jgi:hypothetical protein
LSPLLGGRSEVRATPLVELLKHMELLLQKEEAEGKKEITERWISFLSTHYAHPFSDSKGRKKFMEVIKPEDVSKNEIPKYEDNLDLLKQLKSMQGGG